MFSLCHEARQQPAKEQHVVHNMEQVVEFWFLVACIECGEQFSMFSDQLPQALDMLHCIQRPQLQDTNDHAKTPETLHVAIQWVCWVINDFEEEHRQYWDE
jgi:hypothetical protein